MVGGQLPFAATFSSSWLADRSLCANPEAFAQEPLQFPRLFVLQAAFQQGGDDRKLRKGGGGGLAPGVIARARMPAGWRLRRWAGTRPTPSGPRGIEAGMRGQGLYPLLHSFPGVLGGTSVRP